MDSFIGFNPLFTGYPKMGALASSGGPDKM